MRMYLLVGMLMWALSVGAAEPRCSWEHEGLIDAINSSALNQGDRQKLASHVENAWGRHVEEKPEIAAQQLDVATGLLAGGQVHTATTEEQGDIQRKITRLRDCITNTKAEPSPHELIKALEESGDLPALDRSSDLRGPDLDDDGIRDDIERYLETLPLTDAQMQASRQVAWALQRAILVEISDRQSLLEVAAYGDKAVDCLSSKFTNAVSSGRLLTRMEAITANTKNRTLRYIQYNKALSGTASWLNDGDVCDVK